MARIRRRDRTRVAFAAIAAGSLMGLAACGSGNPGPNSHLGLQTDYQNVARRVLPSVIEIDAGNSTGSGVVLDVKGDIVTNAHVVGTARRFKVYTADSSTPLPGRLIGTYAPADLAVIRVTKGLADLVPAHWANSATAEVGDIVLAMGTPFGLIDSVSEGIVSATGRTVEEPAQHGQPPAVISNAIQTSAPINPGNSGGALVLLNGQVLGIPTLSAVSPQIGSPAQNIGFAIPANTVRLVATQLIKSDRTIRTGLASLRLVAQTHAKATGAANGVTVRATQPGGAAASAGIRPGDVIVALQDQQTQSVAALNALLTSDHPGQKVTVRVRRGDELKKLTVTLGTEPGWRQARY